MIFYLNITFFSYKFVTLIENSFLFKKNISRFPNPQYCILRIAVGFEEIQLMSERTVAHNVVIF